MNTYYKIIEKTKIWFAISGIIIILGIFSIATKGLDFGIDFKGGTITQIALKQNFEKADVDAMIKKYTNDFTSSKVDNTSIEIKSAKLTVDNTKTLVTDLKTKYKDAALSSQEDIGASIGAETRNKAFQAMLIACIAILIYITLRFEINFALAAIVSLVHDVLFMLAFYSIFQIQVDSSFIAAALTVIGYSVHDTIVVFDRIRENQKYIRSADPVLLADASVTQTLARSINTVLSVLITLTAVYYFVPSIRNFSLPLIVGVVSGCYSSIFIASPFWVLFKKHSKKLKLSTLKK
ncbi:MAG: protein translocase subunit SecF [Solirubrobacterales bacterium]